MASTKKPSKPAAKTAGSKNDPRNRDKGRKYFFEGKEVVPAQMILAGRKLMIMTEKANMNIIYDNNKNPLPWSLAVQEGDLNQQGNSKEQA